MLKDRIGTEIKDGMLALIDGGMIPKKMLDGIITHTATSDIMPTGGAPGQIPMKRVTVMVQIDIDIPGQMVGPGRFIVPDICRGIVVMEAPDDYPLAIALGLKQVKEEAKKSEKSSLII